MGFIFKWSAEGYVAQISFLDSLPKACSLLGAKRYGVSATFPNEKYVGIFFLMFLFVGFPCAKRTWYNDYRLSLTSMTWILNFLWNLRNFYDFGRDFLDLLLSPTSKVLNKWFEVVTWSRWITLKYHFSFVWYIQEDDAMVL